MPSFLMRATTNYKGIQFVQGESYNIQLVPDQVLDNWIENGIANAIDFTPQKFVPTLIKVDIDRNSGGIADKTFLITGNSLGAGIIPRFRRISDNQLEYSTYTRNYDVINDEMVNAYLDNITSNFAIEIRVYP